MFVYNYVKENSVYTCTLSISEADCTQCVVYYKDLQGFIVGIIRCYNYVTDSMILCSLNFIILKTGKTVSYIIYLQLKSLFYVLPRF